MNYQNGKIYKVISNKGDDCYVGSTNQKRLCLRFSQHKKNYKRFQEKKYNYISVFTLFEKYGLENCKIILIENYPCKTKDELTSREEYWRKELNSINKIRAFRTKEERKEQKKKYNDENKQKIKAYRQKNKDKIKKQLDTYYQNHKEKYKEYYQKSKEKKKAYYEANKDKIKEQEKCIIKLIKRNKIIK